MPADLIPSVRYTQFIPSCTMTASKDLEKTAAEMIALGRRQGALLVNANCCRGYGPTIDIGAHPAIGPILYEGSIGICETATASGTKTFSSDSRVFSCPGEKHQWTLHFPDDEENEFTASHSGSGSFSSPTAWTATATGTFSDGLGGGGAYSLAIASTGSSDTSSGTFTGTVSGALTGTLSGSYGGGSSSTTYILSDPAPPFPITVTGTGSFTPGVPPNFTIAGSLNFPARSAWKAANVEFTVDGGSGGTVNVTITDIGHPTAFITGSNAIRTQIVAMAGWTSAEVVTQPLWNGATVVVGRPKLARVIKIFFHANFPPSLTPVDLTITDADGNYHAIAILTGPIITGADAPVELYSWVQFAGCEVGQITAETRRASDDFVYARWQNLGHAMQSDSRTILTLTHEACVGPCGETRGFASKVACLSTQLEMSVCGPNGWNPRYAMITYGGEWGGTTSGWQLIASGTGTSVSGTGFTGGPYSIELLVNVGWGCDRTASLVITDVRNAWSHDGRAYGPTILQKITCPHAVTGVAVNSFALYGFSVQSTWLSGGQPGAIGTLTIENPSAACAPAVYDVSGFTFSQSSDFLNLSGWPCSSLTYTFSSLGSLSVTRAGGIAFPFTGLFSFNAAPTASVDPYATAFPQP